MKPAYYDPMKTTYDVVNKPKHYNNHPSGVECIDIVESMDYNIGVAVAYLWRYKDKNGVEDLRKAVWHINREIKRIVKDDHKDD